MGRKVRASELSRLNWPGPVIEFLPAVPHWPGSRRAVGGGVEVRDLRWDIVDRRAGKVGPDGAGESCSGDGR